LASGVGKTTLAEWLIRRLAPMAALKVTVVDSGIHGCPIQRSCGVCSSLRMPYRILVERPRSGSVGVEPHAPRKDTIRLARAGADPVIWVQTRREFLDAALRAGLARVGRRGVVIEGNTAVSRLRPDLALMVDRPGRAEAKPSARAILDRMHAVLLNLPGRVRGTEVVGWGGGIDDAWNAARRALGAARLGSETPGLPVHALDLQSPGWRGEQILDRLVAHAAGSGAGGRESRGGQTGSGMLK
jgi:hypothetical protein